MSEDREDRRPRRRSSDHLLTLDRALLAGTFAIGVAWAGMQTGQGNLSNRVEALERERHAAEEKTAIHDTEIAVVRVKLENIEKAMVALAEATARAVNRMRESDGGRSQ